MALRELITRNLNGQFYSKWGFNVSNTVGFGGRNEVGDVLLIQVMLKFIEQGAPKLAKNAPKGLKDPNGIFDDETARSIRTFQKEWNGLLLRVDGLVHPGSFKNRKIKIVGRQMMIMLLNQFVWIAGQANDSDYTQTVLRQFPQLRFWLRDV